MCSAVLSRVSVAAAALTKGLVTRLVIAAVELVLGVPAASSTVVVPAAKLWAGITLRLRSGLQPSILARAMFMAGVVDPPALGVTIGVILPFVALIPAPTLRGGSPFFTAGIITVTLIAPAMASTFFFRSDLCKQLLDASRLSKLPEEPFVSAFHSLPSHFF